MMVNVMVVKLLNVSYVVTMQEKGIGFVMVMPILVPYVNVIKTMVIGIMDIRKN
jgi:hypothetical protein